MDIRATVKDIVESKGGIAKSADFVAAGIRAVDVVNLCNSGYLTRVRHGYYQMAEQGETTEEQIPIWNDVTLPECKQIILNGKNWSLFFEDTFVRP